jgi:hypothetical protein
MSAAAAALSAMVPRVLKYVSGKKIADLWKVLYLERQISVGDCSREGWFNLCDVDVLGSNFGRMVLQIEHQNWPIFYPIHLLHGS